MRVIKESNRASGNYVLSCILILCYIWCDKNSTHEAINCHNSSLWKRVKAWERSCATSGYGIIWGMQVKTNIAKFSAKCHSVDCSGDSKV